MLYYNYSERNAQLMINKAFDIVTKKLDSALSSQGYTMQNVPSTDSNEMVKLFTGESAAYSVIYYKDKKHMVMRTCGMTDDGPDNEWKTIGTWMFDPATDKEKEAESIGNDFAENVSAPIFTQAAKQQKKKKKNNEEGSGDPLFFSKRLIAVFPELKDEVKNEEDSYEQFRGVTFVREHIVPKVIALLKDDDTENIDKLSQVLSAQYSYGDIDTRSIITMAVLNAITEDSQKAAIKAEMSDELKKAWKAAEKYRGKKVKPAKKQKQSFMQKMMEQSIENKKLYDEGKW